MDADLRRPLREFCHGPLAIADRTLAKLLAGITPGPSAGAAGRGKVHGAVAVVPLYGLIHRRADRAFRFFGGVDLETFHQTFQALVSASSVSTIVLDIDSAGGPA